MCVSFPTPPENRFSGTPPGPLKLFLGGVVFLAVLLFAAIGRMLSRGG